jgi:predicted amidohydrolase
MKTDLTWRACTFFAPWWGTGAWSVALLLGLVPLDGTRAAEPGTAPSTNKTLRVAAVQAKPRVIDFRLSQPADVLAQVDKSLGELEHIVHQAAAQKCDALAFPEDTLGLLNWTGVNETAAKVVLPEAVQRMLDRLGRAAASHRMYLVVCSDHLETDGGMYNTAFFLGRDGKELGRYHKVCPTWSECGPRRRGASFPVFPTSDLGTVGMLICYDLVMPETARSLALAGADLIFFPTMGGAAIGDGDIGEQALRVRAVENFVWLIVAHRGSGAIIISPQGKIVARAEGPDGLAVADIDPFGGREGGDAMNHQRDMRARLFRERNPAAFALLTAPNPAVLDKVPIHLSSQAAGRIAARVLTVGEEEFRAADALARAGKTDEASEAFQRLRAEYRDSWIDRRAQERLATLRPGDQTAAQTAAARPAEAAPSTQSVRLRVAGAQIPVGRDVRQNLEVLTRAIQFAAREQAEVLLTPEGSLSGYTHEFDAPATAQALESVVRQAREANVALVLGTCFADADGARYDAQRFYDRAGNFLGFHSKILLCRRVADPRAKGELDFFKSTPLRTFTLQGLTVGGLICNDLWANPEWTPMADPHLARQLAGLGARVVFLSVNSGQAEGDELALNRGFHESNLRMRARSAKLWMVVADACDPQGQRASNCPSGVLSPDGRWVVRVDSPGEQFFAHTIEVEPPRLKP